MEHGEAQLGVDDYLKLARFCMRNKDFPGYVSVLDKMFENCFGMQSLCYSSVDSAIPLFDGERVYAYLIEGVDCFNSFDPVKKRGVCFYLTHAKPEYNGVSPSKETFVPPVSEDEFYFYGNWANDDEFVYEPGSVEHLHTCCCLVELFPLDAPVDITVNPITIPSDFFSLVLRSL